MTDIVHATFGALELRVPDVNERIVEGIVVPWGETSFLTPSAGGERFVAGSLSRSIGERGHRIKLFHSHDHGRAIGRALAWKPDHELGCWAQFRIAATPPGDEVLAEVGEGMLDVSIGFRPVRTRRGADGAREVLEAALHEVSIAPVGAYDGARVLRDPHPCHVPLDTAADARGQPRAAPDPREVLMTDNTPADDVADAAADAAQDAARDARADARDATTTADRIATAADIREAQELGESGDYAKLAAAIEHDDA